jgi:light-harvesting complex I chlorophyll a/b binding protein 1
MFLLIAALELVNGAAIFDQAKGSGRKPGEFNFDPLSLGKDSAKYQRYSISEVKNGRLAMLAFAGLITQAVLTGKSFPYF